MKKQHYTTPITESIRLCVEYQLCAGSGSTGTGSNPETGTIEEPGGGHRPRGGAKAFDMPANDWDNWETLWEE